MWEWRGTSCSNDGEIRKSFTSFEGTSAMVISWEGFDGYFNPRDGGANNALDFQVILRVDGRITFFYKVPAGGADEWETILDANGWMVGLSGGRSVNCTDDGDCDAAFGTSGLSCDDTNHSVEGNVIWEAKNRCMNMVDFQSTGAQPVSGSWQGE